MSDASLATELFSIIEALPQSKRATAQSLCQGQAKYGSWTVNQRKFAKSLIRQAMQPILPQEDKLGLVGKMAGIYGLFQSAKDSKLKWPKIHLSLEDGSPVVLAIAGIKSKYTGSINITDGGKYPNNVWYGRIDPEGHYISPKNSPDHGKLEQVQKLLRKLAEDPATVAAAHGLTGHCCFCNKELTHDKSLAVGFGPKCAEKWGLKEEWNTILQMNGYLLVKIRQKTNDPSY